MDIKDQEGSTHREPLDFREMVGYAVEDKNGRKEGVVDAVWENQDGHPAFFGIRTGILGLSRLRCLPVPLADVDETHARIRLPFEAGVLEDSPAFDSDFELTGEAEKSVYEFYRARGFAAENAIPGPLT